MIEHYERLAREKHGPSIDTERGFIEVTRKSKKDIEEWSEDDSDVEDEGEDEDETTIGPIHMDLRDIDFHKFDDDELKAKVRGD